MKTAWHSRERAGTPTITRRSSSPSRKSFRQSRIVFFPRVVAGKKFNSGREIAKKMHFAR
jgi:hypothetical protein